MTRRMVLWCAVVFACSTVCRGQDKGAWRAASKTASSITGDLGLGGDKLIISFSSFTISQIRALKTDEVTALFSAEDEAGGVGNLYRLDIPGTKKFLHKNSLCGADDVQWMATSAVGKTLHVAFFSGAKPPVLTMDAVSNTTDLCGTFMYVR